MTGTDLEQTALFIEREGAALLRAWRDEVRGLPSAANLSVPTLNDHMPIILDELASALRADSQLSMVDTLVDGSPTAHGKQRVEDGFDIVEVVCEYNLLRACIYDLARSQSVAIQGLALHVINRVLDTAIGVAVKTFADFQAAAVQRRRNEHLSFIMHDLRTPLNAIALAGRVLEKGLPEVAKSVQTRQLLSSVRRNSEQLKLLVEKILEEQVQISSSDGVIPERRMFDLWPVVELLIRDLQAQAALAVPQLINAVPADLMVFADANLLQRVLQNLITNALRYTTEGAIIVGARATSADQPVECWVSDSGPGIDPELMPRIFEKGTTDDEGPESKGLGLAIVKTYVVAHGGTISVESQPGHGSTFLFTLPPATP